MIPMNVWAGWVDRWLQTAHAMITIQQRSIENLLRPVALARASLLLRPATAPHPAPGGGKGNVVAFPATAASIAAPKAAPVRSGRQPNDKAPRKAKPDAAAATDPKKKRGGRQGRVAAAKPARA